MNTARRFRILGLLTALATISVAFIPPQSAFADTVSITPPKFELFGNPGDVLTEKIKVNNPNTSSVTYSTTVEDFTAAGDEGGVEFQENPDAPTTAFSLAKWVTVSPKTFSVPANDSQTVDVTIRIPQTAEPGSHFASVQVVAGSDAEVGGSASVQSKLNSLILLRVSGTLTEKLSVDQFYTDNSFYSGGPVTIKLRTKDEGNVHLAPTATAVITDTFNHKVAELSFPTSNVLPGSARLVQTTWDSHTLIGKYTITLLATYGDSKQPLTATTVFYVFPTWLLITIGVVVLFIVFFTTQRKRLRKMLHSLTRD